MTNTPGNSSFIPAFVLTFMVALAAMGIFNAIIDPNGRLGIVDIDGLNSVKVPTKSLTRVGKTIAVRNCRYKVMLFGSSRVEAGIDPGNPQFRTDSVFNMSFAGSNFIETRNAMRFARKHQPELDTVLVGVDYLLFTARLGNMNDHDQSPLATGASLAGLGPYLLSLSSAQHSWKTLVNNLRGTPPECNNKGFLDLQTDDLTTARPFKETIRFFFTSDFLYADYQYSPERVAWLAHELEEFALSGVRVHVFIPPVHALQLAALDAAGLWGSFEQWKRDVTEAVAAVNDKLAGEQRFPLWDFTGYSDITTEEIPFNAGDPPMIWWRDSSHHSPRAGTVIVDKLLKQSGNEPAGRPFGRILSPDNIESVLAATRAEKASYAAENPELMALISQLRGAATTAD